MLVAALVILFGAIALSMFVGWIIRIFIFCAFWALLYWWLLGNVVWGSHIAITLGNGFTVSWAAMVPSIICFLCLMFTKE